MIAPLDPKAVRYLVVHCSVSEFGDAAVITEWHTDPNKEGGPFADIGYHFVVLNGRRRSSSKYVEALDGHIEIGRAETLQGAHATGLNDESLGICLIGTRSFTAKQLFALKNHLKVLMGRYNVPVERVIGHTETPYERSRGKARKTCPNIDMDGLRADLR